MRTNIPGQKLTRLLAERGSEMKIFLSLIFVGSLAFGSAALAVAQDLMPAQSDEQTNPNNMRDYGALIQGVFAPITEQLNLTKEQEFRIIAIITATEVKADSLMQELDEVDQQLAQAVLIDAPDEATISGLSSREGVILTQIVQMKVRAHAGIYQLLTPGQRALVSRQFQTSSQKVGYLGSISIY
jgi:Spy/CpxP family protein refolding chaperone